MMAKKQFKTESKRLLDLMINSIYTNREIFLRELISNASDALDKRHYMALTDKDYEADEYQIRIDIDKENRTITITDNGIGMNREELEKNLGTIAHSGSEEFRQKYDTGNTADIIGQFGVGFYSAFMVASQVTVDSKTVNEPANRWISNGQDGYTIEPSDKDSTGTSIILQLREDTDDIKYSDYLDSYKIEELVKKYSDYVRYPIKMETEKTVLKENTENEYETVKEIKTVNSMIPLWKRNKKDISEEDYSNFYSSKFYDWEKPLKTIHYSLEGNVSYTALLYIPSRLPYNFYSKDYEAGLQLYSKGVFVMEHAKDLLPDYYSFVRGLVDSDDVSLNISREILQQDSQLQALRKSVSRRIKSTLVDMMIKDRENYEKFFKVFGNSLKYGVYQNFGAEKEELQDLLMFYSSKEDKYVTLKEYKERMKPDQNEIYYCTGQSIEQIKKLPQIETLLDKGFEILYCIDEIDEFTLMMMRNYDGKDFKSAQQAEAIGETEEEKKHKEEVQKSNESLLKRMLTSLGDKVKDVRISSRLKNNPVCLVADEGISLEMEKYLSQLPGDQQAKATKILEINPNHDIFKVLQKVYDKKPEQIDEYTDILYQQAMLIEGFKLDDPVAFSNKICELMKEANE
ncbi:MAG: molecular chaperone HtpG [Erysipelotrichaceae bacterium]|nr:molecular chaperone HtpG [Erysipelotrichaceae bacterium]